jgi:two-component system, chemotaxis family, sensor kinase CheA
MSNSNQFAATFLQEAGEQLALIEEIILDVEQNPQDDESINRLFRVFHTIKGSGAMFGFDQVAGFTHHIENVLDKVRNHLVPISKELVNVILASKDQISRMLWGSDGRDVAQEDFRPQLIARLNALLPQGNASSQPVTATAAPEQAAPTAASAAPAAYRILFSPEPGILARGLDPASLIADLRALGPCVIVAKTDAVPPLDQLKPDQCALSWEVTLTSDCGMDAIRDVFIFVQDDSKIVVEALPPHEDSVGTSSAVAPVKASPDQIPAASTPSFSVVKGGKASPASGKSSAVHKNSSTDGSVRVPSERLDRLVNLLGELVINQSRLAQVASRLDTPELSAPTEDLERLVSEFRDIVLGIRMMPIGTTFSRFKRLVHDLSDELGKEIDLITEGAETELDKTVIDQLGDPLVHLIRNSIDHGISKPEERIEKGKPRHGTIRLSASHEGAHVAIRIEDDGKGIDKEAVRAKAIEKKLISPDAVLSDRELFNLIFLPGFSTAKAVTSVSGRGVGMDVVKRQIDALRGSVEVSSAPGQGTSITLTLPLTLAIIDGLLVEVNREQFIIPMAMVTENVELAANQRAGRNGRNLLVVRGEQIPYLRLREIFSITGSEQDVERVVIVNYCGNRVGLVVDRVLGSHQTVIQSLGRLYQTIEVASGATIMGDGRVALILDVPGLVHYTDTARLAA